jgi:hypothetical protein
MDGRRDMEDVESLRLWDERRRASLGEDESEPELRLGLPLGAAHPS